jgi:hypothetical protein
MCLMFDFNPFHLIEMNGLKIISFSFDFLTLWVIKLLHWKKFNGIKISGNAIGTAINTAIGIAFVTDIAIGTANGMILVLLLALHL